MDLSLFDASALEYVRQLDAFEQELHSTVIELMSPAYYHETLPSFVKRLRYKLVTDVPSGAVRGGVGRAENSVAPSIPSGESYRLRLFQTALERMQGKLFGMRDICDTNLQPPTTAAGLMAPSFPSLIALRELANQHAQNKIVSTRIHQAIVTLNGMARNSHDVWARENALCEATVNTHQVLVETLARTFFRDVHQMALTLRDFYETKINVYIRRFEQFCAHQKQEALKQQGTFYQGMFTRVRDQRNIAEKMMSVLLQQMAELPQRERYKLEQRVRELQKRIRMLFVEAEIYYQQSSQTFAFQPLSHGFYRGIRKWLIDYQRVLVDEMIVLAGQQGKLQRSPIDDDDDSLDVVSPAPLAASVSTAPIALVNGEQKDRATVPGMPVLVGDGKEQKRTSIAKTANMGGNATSAMGSGSASSTARESTHETSMLRRFLEKTQPTRLPEASDSIASSLHHPSHDVVNDLVTSFHNFYLQTNRANLERLQHQISELDAGWHRLSEQVAKAHEIQQRWYSLGADVSENASASDLSAEHVHTDLSSASANGAATSPGPGLAQVSGTPPPATFTAPQHHVVQLPDIRHHASVMGAGGDGAMGMMAVSSSGQSPSPEVIKLLLRMSSERRDMEAQLSHIWTTLFNQVKPDFLRTQEQTVELAHIVDFLRQWQAISRDWEVNVRQERAFVHNWKDICRANSRYIAMQFVEWNFFVTGQLDTLLAAINLFASTVFHRLGEIHREFVRQMGVMQQARAGEYAAEQALLNELQDDLRRENTHAADELSRAQTQANEWVEQMQRLQLNSHCRQIKQAINLQMVSSEAVITKMLESSAVAAAAATSASTFLGSSTSLTTTDSTTDSAAAGGNAIAQLLFVLDNMYETAIRCEETNAEQNALLSKEQFLSEKLGLDVREE